MARVTRALLFMATVAVIVMALALVSFAFTFIVSSPELLRTGVFPVDVLWGIAIISMVYVATGMFGCCVGYKQTSHYTIAYAIVLFLLACAQLFIALLALSHTMSADTDITTIWSKHNHDLLQSQFQCCGFIPGDTNLVSPSPEDGLDISTVFDTPQPTCDETLPTCKNIMMTYWKTVSTNTSITLFTTEIIPILAIIATIAYLSQTPDGKRWLRVRSKRRKSFDDSVSTSSSSPSSTPSSPYGLHRNHFHDHSHRHLGDQDDDVTVIHKQSDDFLEMSKRDSATPPNTSGDTATSIVVLDPVVVVTK